MIEATKDFRRVKRVWPNPIDIGRNCHYLMERVDDRDLGVWVFYSVDDGLMVHVNLGEECRGRMAKMSAMNAFDWIWYNTETPVIYAAIAEDKRNVHLLAQAVGFDFIFCDQAGNRCYSLERPNVERMAG